MSAALLTRCFEYDAAPADPIAHSDRHRDSPGIYRKGRTYLFSALQQYQLDLLFPTGTAAELIRPSRSSVAAATPDASDAHPLRASEGLARIVNDRSTSPELKMVCSSLQPAQSREARVDSRL